MSKLLQTIPEISVAGGRCPLPPGDKNGDTGIPRQALVGWHNQGARTVFFLDEDAVNGAGGNLVEISDAAHKGGGRVHLIYAGAISNDERLKAALASGASQIVLDVADATDENWVRDTLKHQHQRVLAGVNVHGGDAVDSNGNRVGDLYDLINDLASYGSPSFLISENSGRDHWFHKDRHVLAAICESVSSPVLARGAVKHETDIHALAPLGSQGLEAVIVGKPLVEGAFTLEDAVTAAEARYDPYEWGPPQP